MGYIIVSTLNCDVYREETEEMAQKRYTRCVREAIEDGIGGDSIVLAEVKAVTDAETIMKAVLDE
ncbi:hypothetical protein ACQUF8_14645 [Bacillus subtilis]|uniref:hypothetical protein n=1 Tax=Bacillus subtilis TaxID=1423 RepID=UPI003D162941